MSLVHGLGAFPLFYRSPVQGSSEEAEAPGEKLRRERRNSESRGRHFVPAEATENPAPDARILAAEADVQDDEVTTRCALGLIARAKAIRRLCSRRLPLQPLWRRWMLSTERDDKDLDTAQLAVDVFWRLCEEREREDAIDSAAEVNGFASLIARLGVKLPTPGLRRSCIYRCLLLFATPPS